MLRQKVFGFTRKNFYILQHNCNTTDYIVQAYDEGGNLLDGYMRKNKNSLYFKPGAFSAQGDKLKWVTYKNFSVIKFVITY